MAESIREPSRDRAAFGWSARVVAAIGSTALLVGVIFLVTDRAPGVAWPLVVLGAGIAAMLLSPRNRGRSAHGAAGD